MINKKYHTPDGISMIVTTYKEDTLYTQACLESIRTWKRDHHELIVVVHDESPLMRAYLESCLDDGLIDHLINTISNHGHTRSFNIGVQKAKHDLIFNIGNDICIGPSIVNDCANVLTNKREVGIIGWFWYEKGVFWNRSTDKIDHYCLRDNNNPNMGEVEEYKLRNSKYFTGKVFEGLDGPKWIHLCNTSFFGIRRDVLEEVGSGFSEDFNHYWADDFLNYLVLDKGYDIYNFEDKFRQKPYFSEFQYDNIDIEDRRRHEDKIVPHSKELSNTLQVVSDLGGGMSYEESIMLFYLAKSIKDNSTVINLGTWRGASCILLMEALKDKNIDFYFYDCFEIEGISEMSCQSPVGREEFIKYIEPFINSSKHTINIIEANSLELEELPKWDFIFIDAGHTEECIKNDINLAKKTMNDRSVMVMHDYGCVDWPYVKKVIDHNFEKIEEYKTLAVFRNYKDVKEYFQWK